MAKSFLLSCPSCKKQLKAPADLLGKKIRCKGCKTVFTVKDPEGEKAVAEAPIKFADDDEEEGPAKPYGIVDTELGHRCPHCAGEMEEGDVICLHCGYNTETRERHSTKRVIEPTGGDYFVWLLPGIACVVLVLFCISWDVFQLIYFINYRREHIANEDDRMYVNCGLCCTIWTFVISAYVIFKAARFAILRLILHPKPPEKEIEA